jgi:hypothetical protein
MPYKSRTKPYLLKLLTFLNNRMELSEPEKQYLYSLKKGYEGEVKFDTLTEKLRSECYILNDLLLEINNTEFQIDTTLIYQAKLFLCEIKNFDGEHFYDVKSEKFYKLPSLEINNPLHQLGRKENLLRQFLKARGINIPIEPYVIFIDSEFTLFQAPIHKSIILPTQLPEFIKKLDSLPSKLGGFHKKLADQLVAAHKTVSSHKHEINYDYALLQKGLTCCLCDSFDMTVRGNKLVCGGCGAEEKVDDAVLRCVEEIRVLFQGMRITTKLVYDWCRIIESKKMIKRILSDNFNTLGSKRWVYFE